MEKDAKKMSPVASDSENSDDDDKKRKPRQSAVWGLARKSLAATKHMVDEEKNAARIIGEDEMDEWLK